MIDYYNSGSATALEKRHAGAVAYNGALTDVGIGLCHIRF